jgi:prepilin-type processing-associated H-X9-DG protein
MQGISLPPAKVESKPGEGPHTGGGNFAYVDGHVKWVRDDHVPPPNTGAWAVGVPAKEKK